MHRLDMTAADNEPERGKAARNHDVLCTSYGAPWPHPIYSLARCPELECVGVTRSKALRGPSMRSTKILWFSLCALGLGCSDDGVAADGTADASGTADTGTASESTVSATGSTATMGATLSDTATGPDSSGITEPTGPESSTDPSDPTETGTVSASSDTSVTDASITDSASSGSTGATDSASGSTGATDSASSDASGTSDSVGTSGNASDPTTGNASDPGTTSDGTTGGGGECAQVMCGNQLYECGDCIDNDDDGEIDSVDVECVTPCDDDESTFATGLPGDNMDPCLQDCFFDGDSGSGNDGCLWDLACDPLNPGAPQCPYDPDEPNCPGPQPAECYENCAIPNGCDCFGCCHIMVDGIPYDIFIGDPDCDAENIETCASCHPQASCFDPCEPELCEICFGQPLPPDNCGEPVCMDGQDPCLMNSDCPDGFYCQTGCCEGLD